jgi:hypothetical protein
VRVNVNGISLLRLLIAVILVSTVATAYLNFRNEMESPSSQESKYSTLDSALGCALNLIANDLRLARPISHNDNPPIIIEHLANSDLILISGNNSRYLVDDNARLIRLSEAGRLTLATEIVSLRALEVGRETIVLTVTVRTAAGDMPFKREELRSCSKVVTVGFPLN